ncbi:hypothetical protein AUJ14_02295 [Candidatus Micrarchaeota archaeon CG1_02_55_22]|nr:MAG: hypothetical protein AUJ14_02295 [Candidatus Micrarchaeota archaeon CG1_02_55_22]
MASQTWLVYAIAAMLLFSVGNILLKVGVGKLNLDDFRASPIVLVAVVVLVALLLGLLATQTNIVVTTETLGIGVAFIVFAVAGFILLLRAVGEGQIAIVTAVLSLSTVVVAILSVVFLGDKFSYKELVAMGLAVASIIALVV